MKCQWCNTNVEINPAGYGTYETANGEQHNCPNIIITTSANTEIVP